MTLTLLRRFVDEAKKKNTDITFILDMLCSHGGYSASTAEIRLNPKDVKFDDIGLVILNIEKSKFVNLCEMTGTLYIEVPTIKGVLIHK